MLPFSNLREEQIGDKSILRNIMKMTAPCWTQSLYRYPPLIKQMWLHWKKSNQVSSNDSNVTTSLPKNWKDNQVIRDNIIKACPWCFQENIEHNKI